MDIYQTITDKIVAAIEANPGEFQMPWNRTGSTLPSNALTGNSYNGVNTVTLWFLGMTYSQPIWATYRQWSELGCQVRKGEKGSPIIYYSTYEKEDGDEKKAIPFLKHSSVFNCDQVDGFDASPDLPQMPPMERLANVDAFAKNTEARIIHGGTVACYIPGTDIIKMPDEERFFDKETSTRTESYYSVLLHELVHWTMPARRVGRELRGKDNLRSFTQDSRYAFEELIAELGSAFLCARLHVTKEVRIDHARYIQIWLKAFKGDKMFVFAAGAQAQIACDYLMKYATEK